MARVFEAKLLRQAWHLHGGDVGRPAIVAGFHYAGETTVI